METVAIVWLLHRSPNILVIPGTSKVARLSPLSDTHINVHGRSAFTEVPDEQLRPLRDPTSTTDDD